LRDRLRAELRDHLREAFFFVSISEATARILR